MHDLLEGALQYEVKLLLKFMICEKELFTLGNEGSSSFYIIMLFQHPWMKCTCTRWFKFSCSLISKLIANVFLWTGHEHEFYCYGNTSTMCSLSIADEFNSRLSNTELGYMEAKDKTTPISYTTLTSDSHNLKQSGKIMWVDVQHMIKFVILRWCLCPEKCPLCHLKIACTAMLHVRGGILTRVYTYFGW